jgi:hypothetical protein
MMGQQEQLPSLDLMEVTQEHMFSFHRNRVFVFDMDTGTFNVGRPMKLFYVPPEAS